MSAFLLTIVKYMKYLLLFPLILFTYPLVGQDTTGVYLGSDVAKRVYIELIISEELRKEINQLNAEIVILDSLYDNSKEQRLALNGQLSLSISKIESLERSLDLKDEKINIYQNEIKKHKTHKIIIIAAAITGILLVK